MKYLLFVLLLIPSLCFADSQAENTIGGYTASPHIIQGNGTSVSPRAYLNFIDSNVYNLGGRTNVEINWSNQSVMDSVSNQSGWQKIDNDVTLYSSSDKVGIGTSDPSATLDVQTTTGGIEVNYISSQGGCDDNAVFLTHADGSNGGTTFTEENCTGSGVKAITAVGHTNTSTTEPVFGTAAALFDGDDDYLTTPDNDAFSWSTNDVTIDFRVKFTTVTGGLSHCFFSQYTDSNNRMQAYWADTGTLSFTVVTGGAVKISANSTWSALEDTWYWVKLRRSGNVWNWYVNGSALDAGTTDTDAVGNYTSTFAIGLRHITSDLDLNGRIDEFRVSSVARDDDATPLLPYETGSSSNIPSIAMQGNGVQTAKMWTDGTSANTFKIDVPSTTRLAIDANGNTGLGVTTPMNKLDVYGGTVIGTTYAGSIIAPTNGLLVAGNVGIGTALATEALDIAGKLKLRNSTMAAEDITFDSETTVGLRVTNQYGYVSITPLNGAWAHFYTDRTRFIFEKPVWLYEGTLSAYNLNSLKLQTNGNNRILVTTTGNVGIGTDTPMSFLDVLQPSVASTAETISIFGVSDAPNSYIRMENASSLNAAFMPVISGTNGDDERYGLKFKGVVADADYDGDYYPSLMFQGVDRSGLALDVVPIVSFTSENLAKLTTWYDGRTKIGGTDDIDAAGGGVFRPTSMLDVIGNGSDDLLNLMDETVSRVVVEENGNVGINSSNPNAKLTVNDDNTTAVSVKGIEVPFARIFQYVTSVYTDITANCSTSRTFTGDILNATGDYVYIGHTSPFYSIYFDFQTIMSAGTDRTWEYWNGSTWTAFTPTDGTNQWQADGVVSYSTLAGWATTTVNSVADLYWIRIGTASGTFTVEPTVYTIIPATTMRGNTLEVYPFSSDTAPALSVNKDGTVRIGYADATESTYTLSVAGSGYFSASLATGSISGSSLTITASTTGFTQTSGVTMNGSTASTALIPTNNSNTLLIAGTAWDGVASKQTYMRQYLNTNAEARTNARMAFTNGTVNGFAVQTEVANIETDGQMNILGNIEVGYGVFDKVFQYIGTTYTDITGTVSYLEQTTGDVLDVVGNYVYVGKRTTFSSMYFDFVTIMSAGTTRTWEYWDGDSWAALTVTDGTTNWSADGTVTFTAPVDWAKSTVNSVADLYWVRIGTVSGTFATEPTLNLLMPTSDMATKQVLKNGTFDGATSWSVTGDWAYTTADYTFTYASGVGTLKQAAADLNIPLKANTWYRFLYTIGVAAPAGTVMWIGTEVTDGKTYFTGSTTEYEAYFKTNDNPTDFVIYTSANTTSGVRLDYVSLMECHGGELNATGSVYVGDTLVVGEWGGTTPLPDSVASFYADVDSYSQINHQNLSDGTSASTDYVATADNGDDESMYIDMGINSSGYTGGSLGGANDAYLYSINTDHNIYIGAGSTGQSVAFINGGTDTTLYERMRITSDGNVGIGTVSPTRELQVNGSVMVDDYIYSGKIQHAYGGFQNSATTIAVTQNTWAKITNGTSDLWTGLEADGMTLSSDVMTIAKGGDYAGNLTISLSGGNGDDFFIRIYNNTQARQEGYIIGATTSGAGNYNPITLPIYIEATAGDQLQMEITNITNSDDPTVRSAVFYMHYLHD